MCGGERCNFYSLYQTGACPRDSYFNLTSFSLQHKLTEEEPVNHGLGIDSADGIKARRSAIWQTTIVFEVTIIINIARTPV